MRRALGGIGTPRIGLALISRSEYGIVNDAEQHPVGVETRKRRAFRSTQPPNHGRAR